MIGANVNLQFLLGVEQDGSFRFLVNVEALTSAPQPVVISKQGSGDGQGTRREGQLIRATKKAGGLPNPPHHPAKSPRGLPVKANRPPSITINDGRRPVRFNPWSRSPEFSPQAHQRTLAPHTRF